MKALPHEPGQNSGNDTTLSVPNFRNTLEHTERKLNKRGMHAGHTLNKRQVRPH